MTIQVLFVCTGNICRSAFAEGIFSKMVQERGLDSEISCDSAGTIDYHVGSPADARMQQAANRRGYILKSRARQVTQVDLRKFDYILAMDSTHIHYLNQLDSDHIASKKIVTMSDFCPSFKDIGVPDPYYGGPNGFDYVMDMLEEGCNALLDKIKGPSY